jgi:hypothetical protein
MKRSIIVITFALIAMAQVGSSQQPIPGRGFSVLLCVAEQAGDAGNNQVNISIDSDTGPNEAGVGQAVITISHGQSQSTHIATYQDSNESGGLDCGDAILTVV